MQSYSFKKTKKRKPHWWSWNFYLYTGWLEEELNKLLWYQRDGWTGSCCCWQKQAEETIFEVPCGAQRLKTSIMKEQKSWMLLDHSEGHGPHDLQMVMIQRVTAVKRRWLWGKESVLLALRSLHFCSKLTDIHQMQQFHQELWRGSVALRRQQFNPSQQHIVKKTSRTLHDTGTGKTEWQQRRMNLLNLLQASHNKQKCMKRRNSAFCYFFKIHF